MAHDTRTRITSTGYSARGLFRCQF